MTPDELAAMFGGLVFGDYRECDACSKGLHINHVDVSCDCGLCKEPS